MFRRGDFIAALMFGAAAFVAGTAAAAVEGPVQAELPEDDAALVEEELIEEPDQTPIQMMTWLDADADRVALVTALPSDDIAKGQSALIELGRVAFRSPTLFGGYALELGLSCNACHPAGRAETHFSLPPLSPRPGRIDVSHSLFSNTGDDLSDNPRPISDLTQAQSPFGTIEPIDDLTSYISKVIVDDFSGPEPDALILNALSAYVTALKQSTPLQPSPYADESTDKQYVRYMIDAITRATLIGQRTIEEKQAGASTFVVTALRAEIGLVHERLDPADPARPLLAAHASNLTKVSDLIDAQDWFNAARELRAIHLALSEDLTPLLSRPDLTYFNQEWLAGAIDPSLREPLEEEKEADLEETAISDEGDAPSVTQ